MHYFLATLQSQHIGSPHTTVGTAQPPLDSVSQKCCFGMARPEGVVHSPEVILPARYSPATTLPGWVKHLWFPARKERLKEREQGFRFKHHKTAVFQYSREYMIMSQAKIPCSQNLTQDKALIYCAAFL